MAHTIIPLSESTDGKPIPYAPAGGYGTDELIHTGVSGTSQVDLVHLWFSRNSDTTENFNVTADSQMVFNSQIAGRELLLGSKFAETGDGDVINGYDQLVLAVNNEAQVEFNAFNDDGNTYAHGFVIRSDENHYLFSEANSAGMVVYDDESGGGSNWVTIHTNNAGAGYLDLVYLQFFIEGGGSSTFELAYSDESTFMSFDVNENEYRKLFSGIHKPLLCVNGETLKLKVSTYWDGAKVFGWVKRMTTS